MIRQLEWQDDKVITPFTEYEVMPDGDKWQVAYLNKFDDEPIKYATGHATKEAAKKWAYGNHEEKMKPWVETEPLTDTVNWFKEAKPEPTNKDVCTQIGCHYEEVGEMDLAIDNDDGISDNGTLAEWYKKVSPDMADYVLTEVNRTELLDALADQIVTAIGVAYMMGFDIIGALTEVNASNWSKFENGKAVTDDNGKIIKGSDYFKPQLEKYLGGSND